MKKVNLTWNVLLQDFNAKKIIKYNVLDNDYIIDSIKKAVKKREVSNYKEFKEFIKRKFMAQYWSRAEYEIMVSGLFDTDKPEKIDVWYQIEMNLDNIAEYLITKLKLDLKIE